MSARRAILDGIRISLGGVKAPPAQPIPAKPIPAHPIPARGQVTGAARLDLFAAMVRESQAGFDAVAGWPAALAVVVAVLDSAMAGRSPVAAPALGGLDWAAAGLTPRFVLPAADEPAAVTGAALGIAETGTLMMLSGPDHPTTLNFLPDLHIVLVEAARIVGTTEEALAVLRANPLPRAVNWITGPSRTGDIEQTLYLGAHGPRRLHVVLVHEPRQ